MILRPFFSWRPVLTGITACLLVACSSSSDQNAPVEPDPEPVVGTGFIAPGFPENFELGNKTLLTNGPVNLGSGTWQFNNAVIDTSVVALKNGRRCARIDQTGSISMSFNTTRGVSVVRFKHASYGADGSSTWELWASTNSGSTWQRIGSGQTRNQLRTAGFRLNTAGNVRLEWRKISGGGSRVIIDDVEVESLVQGPVVQPLGPAERGENLLLGNPSNAVTDEANPNNYLVVRPQYTLSYNRSRGIANWVSWHLSAAWLGNESRADAFIQDNTLPAIFPQIPITGYTGSGFDRGHTCPSADRTANRADNDATFLMTNIFPQAPDNNQGMWAQLEDYCRDQARLNNMEMYIIMGTTGQGGIGSNGARNTVGTAPNIVTVPATNWKVIVMLPNGPNDLQRISATTRVIAVMCPNQQASNLSWGNYRVSVDQIEQLTGYDLLSALPDEVENTVEARVDTDYTQ